MITTLIVVQPTVHTSDLLCYSLVFAVFYATSSEAHLRLVLSFQSRLPVSAFERVTRTNILILYAFAQSRHQCSALLRLTAISSSKLQQPWRTLNAGSRRQCCPQQVKRYKTKGSQVLSIRVDPGTAEPVLCCQPNPAGRFGRCEGARLPR